MGWTRSARAVLFVGGLSLLGCSSEEPLEEKGDWEDTGRYAACELLSDTSAACGEQATFNLSGCEKASLGGLARDGLFTMVYRWDGESPAIGAGSFRISGDGSLDSFRGGTPTQRQVDADNFFLSSTRSTSATVTQRNSIVGCRAEGTRLYGCFVNCRNGNVSGAGTFLAEKWAPRAGEAEASGLRLTSESFVAQGLPVDIYVTQGHAYVVSIRDGTEGGGLSVFDVSDKTAPVLKKTISLPTDNYWNGVWAKDNALYVASANTGVIVFDISNPADPQLLRGYPGGGQINVHTVFVEGGRLYAMSSGPTPKTLIFDIHEPLEPVLLGEYAEPGAVSDSRVGYPHDALAFDGRLYINHWSGGYLIVDVSDPAQTKKLGAYTYPPRDEPRERGGAVRGPAHRLRGRGELGRAPAGARRDGRGEPEAAGRVQAGGECVHPQHGAEGPAALHRALPARGEGAGRVHAGEPEGGGVLQHLP